MRRPSGQEKRNAKALRTIRELRAAKVAKLEQFLRWLTEHDMEFHLDDNPADIAWSCNPTQEQIDHVQEMHTWIWQNFIAGQIWDAADRLWDIGGEGTTK